MHLLFDRLHTLATVDPTAVALREWRGPTWTRRQLLTEVNRRVAHLQHDQIKRLAIYAPNSAEWVLTDLAALASGVGCVPLPDFFSDQQLSHILAQACPDRVIGDYAGRLPRAIANEDPSRPFAKLTFTSGTTGAPKGVCLSAAVQQQIAIDIAKAAEFSATDRHLCVMPLAVLLENICGIYAPLSSGAEVIVAPLEELGIDGVEVIEPERLHHAIQTTQATTMICTPATLNALVAASTTLGAPASLRFVAVGGAPCPQQLLDQAASLRLPVYQGYGLSEVASVVSVNRATANRSGSVGQVIASRRVTIVGGEIVIHDPIMDCYLGMPPLDEPRWFTGDLGYLDDDGYLYITGRKRPDMITANGRNISRAWIESELLATGLVTSVILSGDGEDSLHAALAVASDDAAAKAVSLVNARLPRYAHIRNYTTTPNPN